jgi:3-deoxy-manno-octulosonate cytidylyltransferase (CMP-KDO synthetase)
VKASGLADQVWVATEDPEIEEAISRAGGKAVLTRKGHLSGTDRLAEAADLLGIEDKAIVLNVQGDQPLVEASALKAVLEPLFTDPSCPLSTLIYPVRTQEELNDPNCVKTVLDRDGRALYFSRAVIPYPRDPSIPITYYKHLGIYAYRRNFLARFVKLPQGVLEACEKLEQLRAMEYGFPIRVALSPSDSLEVDTPEDLIRAEELLKAGT